MDKSFRRRLHAEQMEPRYLLSAVPLTDLPLLHSAPQFSKTIHLDFDGHLKPLTQQPFSREVIEFPAIDMDGDYTTFSEEEVELIHETWKAVANAFAPFQVNVTTEDPGLDAFYAGGEAIRVLLTSRYDLIDNERLTRLTHPGIAYRGSWYTQGDVIAYVYPNDNTGPTNHKVPGYSSSLARIALHEIGHTFGLHHDGIFIDGSEREYYAGNNIDGQLWHPIMGGTGYTQAVAMWSQGEYTAATQTEDDLELVTAAVPYRDDDRASAVRSSDLSILESTTAMIASVPLAPGDMHVSTGIIERNDDNDVFTFEVQSPGWLDISVLPPKAVSSLDVGAYLYDPAGGLMFADEFAGGIEAAISQAVVPGVYTLVVDGIGAGDPLDPNNEVVSGYTDYGSLGPYEMTAQLVAVPFEAEDMNKDRRIDATDIDLLADSARNRVHHSSRDDLDGDGRIEYDDIEYLVQSVLNTKFGDADLDGDIDSADLGIILNSYGRSVGWAQGNVEPLDTTVNVSDLALVLNNFGWTVDNDDDD